MPKLKQETNTSSAGRDNYIVNGNKTKVRVDNRTIYAKEFGLIVLIVSGVITALIAGYLLYRFGWN